MQTLGTWYCDISHWIISMLAYKQRSLSRSIVRSLHYKAQPIQGPHACAYMVKTNPAGTQGGGWRVEGWWRDKINSAK